MLECSNIVAAIYFCIAAHYIFNLNYHPKSGTYVNSQHALFQVCWYTPGDVWIFVQEKILEIPSKSGIKRHPSSSSHFSGITRIYETMDKHEDQIDMSDEVYQYCITFYKNVYHFMNFYLSMLAQQFVKVTNSIIDSDKITKKLTK